MHSYLVKHAKQVAPQLVLQYFANPSFKFIEPLNVAGSNDATNYEGFLLSGICHPEGADPPASLMIYCSLMVASNGSTSCLDPPLTKLLHVAMPATRTESYCQFAAF